MSNASVRLPAEWEPHRACLFAWPNNPKDWPGKFQAIPWVFAEMLRLITPGEPVILAAQNAAHVIKARRVLERSGIDLSRVEFLAVELDRGWLRDCAPFFVKTAGGAVEARAFAFNAWANYDNFARDAAYPAVIAERLGVPCSVPVHNRRIPVLEGGAVDCNGQGTLVVTEECLLSDIKQVRNPGWNAIDYETVFEEELGIVQTIWLGDGIAGDDTHGHVDDLCRFVTPNTVVLASETNAGDVNYRALRENRERLQNLRLANGSALEAIALPMPAPVVFDGVRLPASYANFYIANAAVVVPTFNDPNDRIALGILAELFPDRTVVGVNATDLVWGFGAVHCLSHEVPA